MENQVTIKSVGVKWGIILALISIVLSLVVNIFEMYGNDTIIQVVSMILLVAALAMSYSEFKSGNEGFMTLGQGFSLGMLIIAISSVISNVFSYFYMTIIDPGMIDSIREIQVTEMENQGLTDEQIEMAMEYAEFFMTPHMIVLMALIFTLFFGAIISVIVAAIMQKKKPVEL
jgi:hypothetical protein